jgi:hypothetical protein
MLDDAWDLVVVQVLLDNHFLEEPDDFISIAEYS